MVTQEIKNEIKKLFDTTPEYVGVGYGYKKTNGQFTDEESIVFFVPEKKPINDIPENEILPSEPIVINEKVIKMDVIEIGNIKALACNSQCYEWQTIPPNNRDYTRPLKGGLSITSTNNLGSVGTLGFVAVDSNTQSLVGVTNNHVVIKDPFLTSERNLSGVIENEYDINNGGSVNPDLIYQPGESLTPPSNYQIGQVVRYVPITTTTGGAYENKVDGALISLSGTPTLSLSESYKQFGITSFSVPTPFASTAEINNLLISNPMLKSSGRTTGVKDGSPCPLRIAYFSSVLPVGGYNLQGTETVATFVDCIIFVRPENDPSLSSICPYPIYAGDSGSALIADFSGTNKIIGLCFAGSDYYGVANRIDNVASELGIEEWDGTLKNLVDTDTVTYKTLSGGNDNKIVNCEGENYWQVGLTNLNNDCI
jgi:hypothetical protein